MLKRYFLKNKKRNFSTASIWIKGGSDADSFGKKGIFQLLQFGLKGVVIRIVLAKKG